MYEGMGIQWASTVLGCVAVALIPIPVLFYMYGHKLRAKSSFAPTPPPMGMDSPARGDESATTGSLEAEKEVRNGGVGAEGHVPKRTEESRGSGV